MAIPMGLGFKNPRGNLRTRYQSTMKDRSYTPTDQPQIDSRKNLFFLLQTFARQAQTRASGSRFPLESSITGDQVVESVRRNGIVM